MVAPKPGRWRHEFPYVAGVAALAHPITVRVVDGSATTESYELNTAERIRTALYHPDSGIITNNMNGVLYFVARGSYDGWADELDGTPYIVLQGIDVDVDPYTALTDAQATPSVLDSTIHTAIDPHANHPSTIAYIFRDDASVTAGDYAERVGELMIRIPELDPAGRPASPAFLSGDEFVDPAAFNGIFLAGAGRYPSRYKAVGVKRTEGDFAIGTNFDWSDAISEYVTDHPNAHIYWWCQAHTLGDGTNLPADLSYPTGREIRKQVWEAIGAGVKGIVWFLFQDEFDNTWEGLASPLSAERMSAVADMGSRLTPDIRRRLLRSSPIVPSLFTASGGGSGGAWFNANFANANIFTKQDDVTGEHLCVVVNRSTSAADITISSATLNGHLIDLETGDRYGLGQAISFSALEGMIFKLDPIVGVPRWSPDYGLGVEEFWADHWANPESDYYLPEASVQLHPNEVAVDPSTIQDAIDEATVPTTFLCAAGSYAEFNVIAKNNLHFVAADPDNRPTFRSVTVMGNEHALYYNGPTSGADPKSYAGMVSTLGDSRYVDGFKNPTRDFIFRKINFVGGDTADPVRAVWYQGNNGTWYTARYKSPALQIRSVRDVLVEDCTISGYRAASSSTFPDTFTATCPPDGHPGLIVGNVNFNVVVRNCTIAGHPFAYGCGFPWGIYQDGTEGNIVYNCTFTDRYHGGNILWLTNDDFSVDLDSDGRHTKNRDLYNSRYNVAVGNTFTGGGTTVSLTGAHCLIAENTWSGNVNSLVGIIGRYASNLHSKGVYYEMYGNVIRDNTGPSIIQNGVGVSADASWNNTTGPSSSSPYICRIGKTTVTGNSFAACPDWYLETDSVGGLIDGPNVESGNTP